MQVKLLVNLGSMVGGGLYGTDLDRWGPLWWSQNTTKGGGLTKSDLSRAIPCPAVVFEGEWGPH